MLNYCHHIRIAPYAKLKECQTIRQRDNAAFDNNEDKNKISVLKATIDETENLLKSKANNFDKSFLQKKIKYV